MCCKLKKSSKSVCPMYKVEKLRDIKLGCQIEVNKNRIKISEKYIKTYISGDHWSDYGPFLLCFYLLYVLFFFTITTVDITRKGKTDISFLFKLLLQFCSSLTE